MQSHTLPQWATLFSQLVLIDILAVLALQLGVQNPYGEAVTIAFFGEVTFSDISENGSFKCNKKVLL